MAFGPMTAIVLVQVDRVAYLLEERLSATGHHASIPPDVYAALGPRTGRQTATIQHEQQSAGDRWHNDESAAMIWRAWLARNVRDDYDEGWSRRGMYIATVVSLTEIPSLCSCP